jgi:hypothetical protein
MAMNISTRMGGYLYTYFGRLNALLFRVGEGFETWDKVAPLGTHHRGPMRISSVLSFPVMSSIPPLVDIKRMCVKRILGH